MEAMSPARLGVGKTTQIGTQAAHMFIHGRVEGKVSERNTWRKGSSTVDVAEHEARYYLHGNKIATYHRGWNTLAFSLAKHPTRTTISRLNHVLAMVHHEGRLHVRGGVVYFGTTTSETDLDPALWYRLDLTRATSRAIGERAWREQLDHREDYA